MQLMAGPSFAGQRDALEEAQPPVLALEVSSATDALGVDHRVDLGDVGLHHGGALRAGDRDAVVAVADEVEVAELVDVDRREVLAEPALLGERLPALPAAVGGGPEAPVEVPHLVDRPDDLLERDLLQAE